MDSGIRIGTSGPSFPSATVHFGAFARVEAVLPTRLSCDSRIPFASDMARRTGGSFANLADLANAGGVRLDLSDSTDEEGDGNARPDRRERIVFVGNGLPLRCKADESKGWAFEWDEDNILAQAKVRTEPDGNAPRTHVGRRAPPKADTYATTTVRPVQPTAQEGLVTDTMEVLHVGCLGVEVPKEQQEEVANELLTKFNCVPVFLNVQLKDKFYRGCCKQLLWPLLHYQVPLSPNSTSRFDPLLWQAYIAANKKFAEKVTEFYDPER